MRLKKRYTIPSVLLGLIFLLSRMDFLTMRSSNEVWGQYLRDSGVKYYSFFDYDFEGRNMHFAHVGKDQDHLLLFVHGSPGSADAYKNYMSDTRLGKLAQMVSVDRPGFGYSGFGLTEPSMEKQAAAIIPIVERYKKGKVILIGHSLGGPVVARMAMDYPELIDGLIMVAPSIDPELEPKEWWRKPMDWILIRWLLPVSLRVCNQEIIPLEAELEQMVPLWEKIEAQTLVVQGENDELVPRENADFAQKMLVNSSKVELDIVEEGNHFILWSKQDRIVDSIIKLLKEARTLHSAEGLENN